MCLPQNKQRQGKKRKKKDEKNNNINNQPIKQSNTPKK
jgi:hypothetical protein